MNHVLSLWSNVFSLTKMKTFNNVDEYIREFEKETQERLNAIRKLVLETAPQAVESISYGMPAYKVNGKPLVYFGGYKSHIGFYATRLVIKPSKRNSQNTSKAKVPFNSL